MQRPGVEVPVRLSHRKVLLRDEPLELGLPDTLAPQPQFALCSRHAPSAPLFQRDIAPCRIWTYSGPVLTLLHLSDLHRTSGPRVRNDELMAAMVSDARRWEAEGIPRPELVLVSGDLVQGSALDTDDPDAEIVAQYAEAGDLLRRLAAEFVGSDCSRVIVVPGNHDVHWRRARSAMTQLPECPQGIAIDAFRPDSTIRWSWGEQLAYRITDAEKYDSRYDHFRQFRTDFYAGIDSVTVHPDTDLVFAEYPSLSLAVVGFASWHGNDCFCHVGDIDPAALAVSQQLLSDSTAQVKVALWHHSIEGGPRAHDYMDRRVVHRLIDFGANVGLHGHRHYPGAAPYELRLPNRTSMAVVSAGSLAVGDAQLPAGERRQFNIIDIDTEDRTITVHVRAMSADGVFTRSHRDDFGGSASITLDLPISHAHHPKPTGTQAALDEAITAVRQRRFKKALELLPTIDDSAHSHAKRQVTIEAIVGLKCHDELLRLLNPPQNADETVRGVALLLEAKRHDDAAALLQAGSSLLDAATRKALAERIAIGRTRE